MGSFFGEDIATAARIVADHITTLEEFGSQGAAQAKRAEQLKEAFLGNGSTLYNPRAMAALQVFKRFLIERGLFLPWMMSRALKVYLVHHPLGMRRLVQLGEMGQDILIHRFSFMRDDPWTQDQFFGWFYKEYGGDPHVAQWEEDSAIRDYLGLLRHPNANVSHGPIDEDHAQSFLIRNRRFINQFDDPKTQQFLGFYATAEDDGNVLTLASKGSEISVEAGQALLKSAIGDMAMMELREGYNGPDSLLYLYFQKWLPNFAREWRLTLIVSGWLMEFSAIFWAPYVALPIYLAHWLFKSWWESGSPIERHGVLLSYLLLIFFPSGNLLMAIGLAHLLYDLSIINPESRVLSRPIRETIKYQWLPSLILMSLYQFLPSFDFWILSFGFILGWSGLHFAKDHREDDQRYAFISGALFGLFVMAPYIFGFPFWWGPVASLVWHMINNYLFKLNVPFVKELATRRLNTDVFKLLENDPVLLEWLDSESSRLISLWYTPGLKRTDILAELHAPHNTNLNRRVRLIERLVIKIAFYRENRVVESKEKLAADLGQKELGPTSLFVWNQAVVSLSMEKVYELPPEDRNLLLMVYNPNPSERISFDEAAGRLEISTKGTAAFQRATGFIEKLWLEGFPQASKGSEHKEDNSLEELKDLYSRAKGLEGDGISFLKYLSPQGRNHLVEYVKSERIIDVEVLRLVHLRLLDVMNEHSAEFLIETNRPVAAALPSERYRQVLALRFPVGNNSRMAQAKIGLEKFGGLSSTAVDIVESNAKTEFLLALLEDRQRPADEKVINRNSAKKLEILADWTQESQRNVAEVYLYCCLYSEIRPFASLSAMIQFIHRDGDDELKSKFDWDSRWPSGEFIDTYLKAVNPQGQFRGPSFVEDYAFGYRMLNENRKYFLDYKGSHYRTRTHARHLNVVLRRMGNGPPSKEMDEALESFRQFLRSINKFNSWMQTRLDKVLYANHPKVSAKIKSLRSVIYKEILTLRFTSQGEGPITEAQLIAQFGREYVSGLRTVVEENRSLGFEPDALLYLFVKQWNKQFAEEYKKILIPAGAVLEWAVLSFSFLDSGVTGFIVWALVYGFHWAFREWRESGSFVARHGILFSYLALLVPFDFWTLSFMILIFHLLYDLYTLSKPVRENIQYQWLPSLILLTLYQVIPSFEFWILSFGFVYVFGWSGVHFAKHHPKGDKGYAFLFGTIFGLLVVEFPVG